MYRDGQIVPTALKTGNYILDHKGKNILVSLERQPLRLPTSNAILDPKLQGY